MTTYSKFYNLHDVPEYELANQRYAMAQEDYSKVLNGESLTVDRQERILDIAIQGIDALLDVKRFADELASAEGPAGIVAKAFADEIRRALKGAR